MSYNVDRLPTVIQLGRETETGVQEVRFDVSGWLAKWPGMQLSMLARTPGGNVYPAVVTMTGTELVWRVSDADTAEPGTGGAEIVGELDGARRVSAMVATRILPRMPGTVGEVPGPAQVWVDDVLAAAGRAGDAAQEAAQSAAAAKDVQESIRKEYAALSDGVNQLKANVEELESSINAPIDKTADMTQPVGKDADGKLWTAPASGGSSAAAIDADALNAMLSEVYGDE
ncbi:MAG: hypothetical protein ACI4MJ_01590 [Aristaeellaceae bacterium]